MLPSRSRVQSWNPESLAGAADTIRSAGALIYRSIRELDDEIDRMPEAAAWSGTAHRAAADMFGRATDRSSGFKDYAETVAAALTDGSTMIGRARAGALSKAAEIDSGPLSVSDQWVAMIDPAGMSAERAAELEKQAKAAQAQLNPLVIAVDQADDHDDTFGGRRHQDQRVMGGRHDDHHDGNGRRCPHGQLTVPGTSRGFLSRAAHI